MDTSRVDGVTLTANGLAEIVRGGIVATFAPAVSDYARCVAQLARLDPDALQPSWTASPDSAQSGFSTDDQGNATYRDGAARQTLYPAFADPAHLDAAL